MILLLLGAVAVAQEPPVEAPEPVVVADVDTLVAVVVDAVAAPPGARIACYYEVPEEPAVQLVAVGLDEVKEGLPAWVAPVVAVLGVGLGVVAGVVLE